MVDSSFWIAIKYVRDKYHKQAISKFKKYIETEVVFTITDYIILETYAFMLRKASYEVAQNKLYMFLNSAHVQIYYNTEQSFLATYELCKKYPELSYVDANIVYTMHRLQIPTILSFDKNFDRVTTVNRIY